MEKEKRIEETVVYTYCPQCRKKVTDNNFCVECGAKLHKQCNCFVLHKPYDCGHSSCPGYSLLIEMAEK